MRTIHLAVFAVGVLALSVATAIAQTSPILNIIDVQKLVASETASDHVRLAAHFSALADRSASEAKRHDAMSTAFAGNPSRQLGASMSVHCTSLAKLNREAAATLGQLAAHHNKVAGGVPSALPPNAAAYQSGKGARAPKEAELRNLAATASTAADHRALMEYFAETAKRHTVTGDEHVRMAQSYRGTKIAQAAAYCDRMVTLSRDAAKEAAAASAMHKDLAAIAR